MDDGFISAPIPMPMYSPMPRREMGTPATSEAAEVLMTSQLKKLAPINSAAASILIIMAAAAIVRNGEGHCV